MDFPGLDPLADHRSRFVKFGQMNNLFVYVVSYMMGPLQKAMEKHQTCSATNRYIQLVFGLIRFQSIRAN